MKSTKKKRTVLVTGGAGYVGSLVVRALLNKGYEVKVLDKLVFGDEALREIKNKITLIKQDIVKVKPQIFKNVFAVIHLAGVSTDPTAQYNPRFTDLVNHIATERLARMAKKAGVQRFVFASTCSVYFTFNTPLEPPFYKEDAVVNPVSSYALSKRAAEEALLALADKHFQPVIFRKGTLYGLSPRMRYDLVVNTFTKDAYHNRQLTIDCGGQIWRPLFDVQDLPELYIKAIELPAKKVAGKIFNLASSNTNIGELGQLIKNLVKKEKNIDIEVIIKPFGFTRNYKADASLVKKVFGFKPSRTLTEAVWEIWKKIEDKTHNALDPKHYNDIWHRLTQTKPAKK